MAWQQWLILSSLVGPAFNSTTKCFGRSSAALSVSATIITVCPKGTVELEALFKLPIASSHVNRSSFPLSYHSFLKIHLPVSRILLVFLT